MTKMGERSTWKKEAEEEDGLIEDLGRRCPSVPLAKIVMNRPLLLRLLWEVTGRWWSQKDDVGRGLLSGLWAPILPPFWREQYSLLPAMVQRPSVRPPPLLSPHHSSPSAHRLTEGKGKFEFNISPPLAHARRHLRGKEEVLNHILTTGKADRGKREREGGGIKVTGGRGLNFLL